MSLLAMWIKLYSVVIGFVSAILSQKPGVYWDFLIAAEKSTELYSRKAIIAQFPSHTINCRSLITTDILDSIKMYHYRGNSTGDKCNGPGSTLRKSVFMPQEMD